MTGDTDPLRRTVSAEATVDPACEESDERIVPLETIPRSGEVFIDDRLGKVLNVGVTAVVTDGRGDRSDKAEEYKFATDFGDSGGVIVVNVLSIMEPDVGTVIGLEDNEAASPLIETGSVLVLKDEDMRPLETEDGYWPC